MSPSTQTTELDLGPQPAKRSPSSPVAGRIPELDGFRAIAIWAVLIAHAFYGWNDTQAIAERFPQRLQLALGHGWLGVDLFFVLSGFLITGILLDTREHPAYFKNFYVRRALRILPLYFGCIVVMSLGYRGYGPYFLTSVFFLANLARLFGVPAPHGPGVFWSLAVEEHFYLLWPVLNRFLRRRLFAMLAILLVVLTPVARIVFAAHGLNTNEQVYLYSWFRFDGLALGALLAMWDLAARGGVGRRQFTHYDRRFAFPHHVPWNACRRRTAIHPGPVGVRGGHNWRTCATRPLANVDSAQLIHAAQRRP